MSLTIIAWASLSPGLEALLVNRTKSRSKREVLSQEHSPPLHLGLAQVSCRDPAAPAWATRSPGQPPSRSAPDPPPEPPVMTEHYMIIILGLVILLAAVIVRAWPASSPTAAVRMSSPTISPFSATT